MQPYPGRLALVFWLAWVLVRTHPAWPAPGLAPSSPAAPSPGNSRSCTVLPPSFLRGYDPITVFFTQPRGPRAGGPEDHPGNVLKIEPAPVGEYRWLDGSTLIFKPASAWPPLERFRLTAAGETRTLTTLMVPPEAISPEDGRTNLKPVDEIVLTFKEPIAADKLARMVSFELRPLPGIDRNEARRLGASDFQVKTIERASSSSTARYVFRLKQPVPDGMSMLTHIRLSLDDTAPDCIATYSFSTRDAFRVVAGGCFSDRAPKPRAERVDEETSESGDSEEPARSEESGQADEPEETPASPAGPAARPSLPVLRPRSLAHHSGMLPLTVSGTRYTREQAVDGGNGAPRIGVLFSGELAPLSLTDVKALVHFTPAIPEMTFVQSGSSLCLTGRIERDTVYRATLSPAAIHDRQGRPLRMDGPSEFHFFFRGQPSYLRWGQSQGIVERFGPQVFPMSARGDGRVDLRIYPVDPLDRTFWPFPEHAVLVDESSRPPGPGEEPPRADTFMGPLSEDDLKERLLMLGSPPVSTIATLPVRREGGATDFGLSLGEHLAALSGPDAPGTYLVGVRRLNGETSRSYVRIQITDLCLSTVEEPRAVQFLVTSLKTGRPVPSATVRLEGIPRGAATGTFRVLVSGSTDSQGMYRLEHGAALPGESRRIVVKKENDTLVLHPADPPHTFANNHWHRARGRWLAWLSKAPAAPPAVSSLLMAHILTERPVYRPEEEVHVKGYLRVRDAGRLTLAPRDPFELVVSGPGEKTWTRAVELTPEGSFYHRFQEKELPTGDYSAVLRHVPTGTRLGEVSWKAEAYTIPRFEVEVHGPDRAPMDRPFAVTATARYYAGGRVVGQPVRWRVMQFPYAHVPAEEKEFAFSSDERYSRAGRFTSPGTIVKSETTDDSGASSLTINPALELDARPRRYVFEATVTGTDEQTVTNTRQVLALPPFVLGVKVERFQTGGGTIAPEIVAVAPDGQRLAGQEVTVRLLQRQWHSTLTETDFTASKAKYLTDVVDREVHTTTVKTARQPVKVELPAKTAGIYVVEVSARDRVGRLQLVSVDLYKGGTEALTWKKPEANVFETVPDKPTYEPGDTARILLKSPYQTALVLAVVEGPDGNVYQELGVEGGKGLFTLPVRNEHHPRLPVHFLLMRGRVAAGPARGLDPGKPGTMAATAWLKVDPKDNRLRLKLNHPERALPGQEISVGIRLERADGKPVPGEVTLWLVDQAVLALGKERELDPLPSFIRDVKSNLAIRDTRNRTVGEIVTEENPGGSGTEEQGVLGHVTPRKRFKTVPYFDPRIMVDATGSTTVTFKLSDDLTNFKVRAVAASGPDRFGSERSTIAVRLPIIVQPQLPRFVRVSDKLTAGGVGRVVEGAGGPGRFEVKADGATITGATTGAVTWVRDRPLHLGFPLEVRAPAARDPGRDGPRLTLTLAVIRDSDRARDAFALEVPILPDREPVRADALARLVAGKTLSFPEFDRNVRPGSVTQEALITDQEAILRMIAAMDFLQEYPHGCTEQRVSRCYPTVALRSLLDAFRLAPDRERAERVFAETIDQLGKALQPGGLYSYWPGSPGQVSLTAYVVEFLVDAKRAGRTIPSRLLERPVAALKEALRSDYAGFVDGRAFSERCEALRALAAAGASDVAYCDELARKSAFLDPCGQAAVLMACAADPGRSAGIARALRRDLWGQTVFQLWDGREVYGGLQSTVATPGGPIPTSEVRTLATMIRALLPQERSNPRMKLMVDHLVRLADRDGWGDTASDAAALLALKDVVSAPRKLASPARFEIACGELKQALALDDVHPTVHFETGSVAPACITWTGGAPGAALWVKMDVSCLPAATGDTVPPRCAGFVVRHEMIRVPEGDASPSRTWIEKEGQSFEFRTGDVVEEHVQVVNPADRNHVAVVVPLAAGMEPLNPELRTAPPEAKPSAPLTREPSYSMYRDDEARFYYESLPAGTYDFHFRTRATIAGSFVQPGARAEMMYRPGVRGSAAGARYVVARRQGK